MTTQPADTLHAVGLRVTRPRLAVLEAVRSHPHADAQEVLTVVREHLPKVSHQAVYDCLAALSSTGLLRRIEPAGSAARFEIRRGDNHHHLICRFCGRVVDVHCTIGDAPCLTVDDTHGFTVDEAEVVYWGTCPACTESQALQRD